MRFATQVEDGAFCIYVSTFARSEVAREVHAELVNLRQGHRQRQASPAIKLRVSYELN